MDPDRDTFLGARYQDEHDPRHLRNCFLNCGMYGKPLSTGCTAAVYPFFPGSPELHRPGVPARAPGPRRALGRWVGGIFCQLKPVGMYYDRGVYVPIYDLDYPVTGPGPFPWPVFFKRPTGG